MTNRLPNEPKTPHEEVMLVVESTNDIVSEISHMLERWVYPILREKLEQMESKRLREK